ncbi:PAS and helix-turn-helix domain-containing protein [Neorhodopirellula pilleata]|uniref:Oxygen regulatory protein NreC n=1 Tax=Neorhodopirellula pilleata TaxID=2714738 RepID=A0A5C5ZY23_9BACT|nr:PAS and helix-turn-helix domain-containing protein [Neorhodopirellula pilleata]TWT92562.1 Oxygen regulatory protein NreC [Neorhodopirellula pilleata]
MNAENEKRESSALPRSRPSDVHRQDEPHFDPASIWSAISKTPGVGISIMDSDGGLLFINDTSKVLFFDRDQVDYQGKTIRDFHPPEYVQERLELIARVLESQRPVVIGHIYHGRKIESTVWPLRDSTPPFNRVIVVTHLESGDSPWRPAAGCETYKTQFIDLGPLNVLTKRELEVLALLGHGMSVPKAAAILHRSPKTIERHKESIGQKLQMRGQAELVALVTSMGLDLSDTHLRRFSDRPE